MKKTAFISAVLFSLPLISLAAGTPNLEPFKVLVQSLGDILNMLIPILIAAALIVFFWGLVRYVWGHGGASEAKEGKQIMLAGLITLFVMVSVWGIITLAQSALGVEGTGSVYAPYTPTQQQQH
jgi:hypothetical protein